MLAAEQERKLQEKPPLCATGSLTNVQCLFLNSAVGYQLYIPSVSHSLIMRFIAL